MDTKEFEKYQFLRLYSIDLDTALHTFRILKRYKREDIRRVLLRDVAVAYARPFSGNKGQLIPKHQLQEKHVPVGGRGLHEELIRLRNEQFAHTDLKFYRPKVARFGSGAQKWFPMAFRGYDYGHLFRQLTAIESLIKYVEHSVRVEIGRYEQDFQRTWDGSHLKS